MIARFKAWRKRRKERRELKEHGEWVSIWDLLDDNMEWY